MPTPPKEKTELNILIVDDHHLTRDMVRMILKGSGYNNLFTAESAFLAHERLKEGGMDLVICDWNMPRFSGLELLRELRSNQAFKGLPFLMLTAEAYRESVREAMKAGVTDYIAKPFTAEILQQKIDGIFGP